MVKELKLPSTNYNAFKYPTYHNKVTTTFWDICSKVYVNKHRKTLKKLLQDIGWKGRAFKKESDIGVRSIKVRQFSYGDFKACEGSELITDSICKELIRKCGEVGIKVEIIDANQKDGNPFGKVIMVEVAHVIDWPTIKAEREAKKANIEE